MDLKLPNLGEGADSGTLVNLFVKEGDQIAKDQAILELENEKAVATIPAAAGGKVAKIYVRAGEKLSVGQSILALEETEGKAPAKETQAQAADQEPAPKRGEQPAAAKDEESEGDEEPAASPQAGPSTGIAAAPSLRKMAQDLGIDLNRVRGSARGGRIVLEDLRRYIQQLQKAAGRPKAAAPQPMSSQQGKPAHEPVDFAKWGPISKKTLSPLRQVIARRMIENWTTIPHVTQFDEADITALMALRKEHAPAYEQKGARLTLTSFALPIVAGALKQHPQFNSSLEADEIVLKEYYHIGIAVDTEAGLIVPVIRDVDKKTVLELLKELEDLARRARERKVSGEELKGGTFTISNQGGIGGGHFTPIINKPEVALLGLGRGTMKAVVRDGKIEPRLMLPLALSYDHRVIDGGAAARFIIELTAAFENFKAEQVRL